MKAERNFILGFLEYATGFADSPPRYDLPLLNWQIIIDEILNKEIYPLFFEYGCLQGDFLPLQVREAIEGPFFANSLKNLKYLGVLKEILTVYQKEKIDVVVLKGPVIAEKVWENFSLRTMGDLDILVKKEDLERAKHALINHGYVEEADNFKEEQHYHLVPLLKPGINILVEIHHNITWPSALFPVEKIWDRSLEIQFSGVPARMPCWQDLFIHHMLNLTYQPPYDRSLRTLADSAKIFSLHGSAFDIFDTLNDYEDAPFFPYLRLSVEMLSDLLYSNNGRVAFPATKNLSRGSAFKWALAKRIYYSRSLWSHVPTPIVPDWIVNDIFAGCVEDLPGTDIIRNALRAYFVKPESLFADRHIPIKIEEPEKPRMRPRFIKFLLLPIKLISRAFGRLIWKIAG